MSPVKRQFGVYEVVGGALAAHAGNPRFNLSPHKWDLVVYACNLRTGEVQAGGSEVSSYPQLHSEFRASLDYMRLFFFKKNRGR